MVLHLVMILKVKHLVHCWVKAEFYITFYGVMYLIIATKIAPDHHQFPDYHQFMKPQSYFLMKKQNQRCQFLFTFLAPLCFILKQCVSRQPCPMCLSIVLLHSYGLVQFFLDIQKRMRKRVFNFKKKPFWFMKFVMSKKQKI